MTLSWLGLALIGLGAAMAGLVFNGWWGGHRLHPGPQGRLRPRKDVRRDLAVVLLGVILIGVGLLLV